MRKMTISRKKKKDGISREELEEHVRKYLDSGRKISKLKAFEPAHKSKAYQKGHLYDIDSESDAGFEFTEFPLD